MRRHMCTLLASLSVGAMSSFLATSFLRADDPNAPPAAGMRTSLQLPAGFTQKDLKEEKDIKNELASLTENAVTKDHFDNLCNCLTKQDKDRIGEYKDRDVTKLNGRVDQIQRAWKEKYGKDFDFDKAKVIFDDRYTIVQGEVSDPAVAIMTWPVQALSNEPMKASEMQKPAPGNRDMEKKEAKDAKLDKGRNVALVKFPAEFNTPDITVSMIHQLPDNWKIDVPNTRSGEQIYNDLLTQLTWLGDHSSQWPANQDDVYRMFAHHVVAALYGAQPTMAEPGPGAGANAR